MRERFDRARDASLCLFAASLALSVCACRSASKEAPPPAPSRALPSASSAPAPAQPNRNERYEILAHLDSCEVYHRGILLDLGTPGVQARRRFSISAPETVSVVDREGASFERVQSSNLWFDVWVDQAIQKPTLLLRVHGAAARLLHLAIDDLRLGALRMPGDETRVLSSAAGSAPLARGRHRIALRFAGAPRSNKAPLAEIDWIRLGEPEPEPARYAAPTLRDIVDDVALGKVPKKSLVLRAPSNVRCWLRPSPDARLKLSAGLLGAGKGVAEVSLIRDSEPPIVLQTRKVAGGDGATWTPIALDLGAYSQSLVGLEFAVREATRGGRVAFGDPVIVPRDEEPMEPPHARLAVVVVLAASDRARIPPWGPTGALKTWGSLARAATSWSAHRAPSSVAAASLATLLTGRSPAAHGVVDSNSRLAPELHVISEIVKEASGRTAMFTGSPTTFAPFGFDQGWDLFDMISPVKDLPAVEPIVRATRWLEQAVDESNGAPILALIHARGAHPPWDISREEALLLKPTDYSGAIDPRRGGIIIGALRGKRHRIRRLSDEDWSRIRSLGDASLGKQDAALGDLVASLKRRGVWDDTLLIVTGDVAPGEPPEFPFDPKGALTEDRLLVPLLIKWPGGSLAGKELSVPSSVQDLTITLLDALGLRIPRGASGLDLYTRALGRHPVVARTQIASLADRYSSRQGAWLLRGQIGSPPNLCALDVDPACASDVADRELIPARALWESTYFALSEALRLVPADTSRRPVVVDSDTSAALVVWGDQY
jgi:hypothetical protein